MKALDATLAFALALAGCDWSAHRMQEPVACPVHGATTLLPAGTCDLAPPDGIVAVDPAWGPPVEPPPVTRALLVRGRDRFELICAACHGLHADGISEVARAMRLRRPPSLVDAAASALSDARIVSVMATGYGVMPPYRELAVVDRYAVMHYIRALQAREVTLAALPPDLRAEALRWLP